MKSQLQRGREADWDLDEFTGEALAKTKEMQLRYVSGVVMTAANGAEFDQIWDDRAGLTYS